MFRSAFLTTLTLGSLFSSLSLAAPASSLTSNLAPRSLTCTFTVRQTRNADQSWNDNEVFIMKPEQGLGRNEDLTVAQNQIQTGPGISVGGGGLDWVFEVVPYAPGPIDKWDVAWKYSDQGSETSRIMFTKDWTDTDGNAQYRMGSGPFSC